MHECQGFMLIYFLQFEGLHQQRRQLFEFLYVNRFLHPLYYNPMNFSYEEYYAQMNALYLSVFYWPQPFQYYNWYQLLNQEQQANNLTPSQYSQVYSYAVQNATQAKTNDRNQPKLSRGQKRKIKKKQLQEQLERQTKAIGKWVHLERKDLIEGLQNIEKQEEKERKKKTDKLSHLYEINKEVSKWHRKKEAMSRPQNQRVSKRKAKKRQSYVKLMKEEFEKRKGNEINFQIKEEDWQSDSEEEQVEPETKKEQKQERTAKRQMSLIEYKCFGRLTGVKWNNIYLREWVTNSPSQSLNELVLQVVNRLAYKQAIRRVQRPEKAKKLIVSGVKQSKRTITTIIDKKRTKMIIVALNIERNPFKGGIDDQVQSVIQLAQQLKVPIIHACNRSHLGRAFAGKWGPRISMVSIINYEGYQDMIDTMLKEWQLACQKYQYA